MADLTNDITRGLLEQIQGFERELKAVEVGTVAEVGDGIARVVDAYSVVGGSRE